MRIAITAVIFVAVYFLLGAIFVFVAFNPSPSGLETFLRIVVQAAVGFWFARRYWLATSPHKQASRSYAHRDSDTPSAKDNPGSAGL
jgi:hypothetical protein